LIKLKPGQPIQVDGDEVEYFEKEGKIVAEGNVSITYGDATLTCDRIEVDTRTRQAMCEGNVRIEQPGEGTLTAEHIQYDLAEKKGEIAEAEVKAFPWFGRAEKSSKVGENEYVLRNGYITTCDLDEPHYRLKAEEIRVFPDDKVIAKNVFFYIGKVPVFWFPYYYHPIIQSRAKVQFIPGQSTDWGNFLLSAWRFYIKGNSKVDILADYRSKKGFAEGANLYYNSEDFEMPGLGEGLFRWYSIHENKWGTYDRTPFRDEWRDPARKEGVDSVLRKRFQWTHRIDFEPETVGMLEFNKITDGNILKDYFYNEYEETGGSVPSNYVSVISAKPNYTFSIEANKRFNSFYTVTQKLPELKVNVPNQRLWETPFHYTTETSAAAFDKVYASNSSPSEEVNRLDSFHKLSYVTRLGPLEVTPYGTFRETIYSRTRWSDRPVTRATTGGGLDASLRLYRIFNVVTNAMGLDINGLRHIIVPAARYFHTHQPAVDKNSLFQMDGIDGLEKTNGVTLSLENKLQTKRGAEGDLKSIDLVRFIVSTDYLFRMKKYRFELEDGHRFENLTFGLELSPYNWLFIDSEMEVIPEDQTVNTGSVEASITPWDSFRAAMGYRYEKKDPDPRNQFTFDISYIPSPKWRLGLYERFDFQNGMVEEQQISITRDLHCWEVEFVYDVDGGNFFEDEFTVWLAFKIKAFPDLQLGLNRSFSKRPPGSSR